MAKKTPFIYEVNVPPDEVYPNVPYEVKWFFRHKKNPSILFVVLGIPVFYII